MNNGGLYGPVSVFAGRMPDFSFLILHFSFFILHSSFRKITPYINIIKRNGKQ